MASGPLKIEKGTCPVLILATHRHTTESAGLLLQFKRNRSAPTSGGLTKEKKTHFFQ